MCARVLTAPSVGHSHTFLSTESLFQKDYSWETHFSLATLIGKRQTVSLNGVHSTPCQDPRPVNSAQPTQSKQKKTSLGFAGNYGPLAHNELVSDRGQFCIRAVLRRHSFTCPLVPRSPRSLTAVLRGIYRQLQSTEESAGICFCKPMKIDSLPTGCI